MDEPRLFLFLLIVILVIILFAAIIVKIPEVPNSENVIFSSTIKGCAQRESGMAPRGDLIEDVEPTITLEENKIKYSRILTHLCCRMVRLDRIMGGWTINIYENWSGPGCRCMCSSEISVKIENLQRGTYTVNVYEKGVNTDGSLMEEKLIISKYVTV